MTGASGGKSVYMKLDHIAVIASTEASVDFYQKLGFSVISRRKREHDEMLFMAGNGVTLELFIDPAHPARVDRPEALGLRHLAFDVDDLDEILARFDCEPVRLSSDGIRITFTKDPDGVPIEFRETAG